MQKKKARVGGPNFLTHETKYFHYKMKNNSR